MNKRPLSVWVIAAVCIMSALSQLFSHTMLLAATGNRPTELQAYLDSWSIVDVASPYFLNVLLLSAALALILLRRVAIPIFGVHLALVLLASIQHAANTIWFQMYGALGVVVVALAAAAFGFNLVYLLGLQSKGILI